MEKLLRSALGRVVVAMARAVPPLRFILNSTYDPKHGFVLGSGDMKADWNKRARGNARYFISSQNDPAEFASDGEAQLTSEVIAGIPLDGSWKTLEIGCGSARLIAPLSRRVGHAAGVDISGEMIRQAKEHLAPFPNTTVYETDGDLGMFTSATIDFCYSYRVFLHVPDKGAIERYVTEAFRVLKPGGYCRLDFAIDRDSSSQRSTGTWFGARYDETEAKELMARHGFKILTAERSSPSPLWDSLLVTATKP